jgi:hypothetical protein
VISYDPNYRPLLWKSREQATEQMRAVLPQVDVIKLSDEETELVTGYADPQAAAEQLIAGGARIAAVTLGKDGVLIASKDGCETVPGFRVEAVDTTGAGDAFWGAFLYCICGLGSLGGYGRIAKLDGQLLGLFRRKLFLDGVPEYFHAALVPGINAAEDFHQSRLPGAVFAQQSHDLAGVQIKRYAVKSFYAREGF